MYTLINGFLTLVICASLYLIIRRWIAATHWMISNLDYRCSRCGGCIYLSPWQATLAIHSMGRKWVPCPHCGQMTWAVPIQK